MLQVLDELPEGLLEAGPADLLKLFGGPALLHLGGQRPRPLLQPGLAGRRYPRYAGARHDAGNP